MRRAGNACHEARQGRKHLLQNWWDCSVVGAWVNSPANDELRNPFYACSGWHGLLQSSRRIQQKRCQLTHHHGDFRKEQNRAEIRASNGKAPVFELWALTLVRNITPLCVHHHNSAVTFAQLPTGMFLVRRDGISSRVPASPHCAGCAAPSWARRTSFPRRGRSSGLPASTPWELRFLRTLP